MGTNIAAGLGKFRKMKKLNTKRKMLRLQVPIVILQLTLRDLFNSQNY